MSVHGQGFQESNSAEKISRRARRSRPTSLVLRRLQTAAPWIVSQISAEEEHEQEERSGASVIR